MNVEDLKPGDIVKFNLEPGCPGEFRVHGIAPIVNRQHRTGWFLGIEESEVAGHRYKIAFTEPEKSPKNG